MENKTNDQEYTPKPANSWTKSEQESLVMTLTVLINGQKGYGRQHSVKDTYAYYRAKLERRFTVSQVLYALDVYTDKQNDIPAPADVIQILDPPKPRITEAQFIEAQKWQERNGYPMFSDAKTLIEKYRKQEAEKQDEHKSQRDMIQAIASGADDTKLLKNGF